MSSARVGALKPPWRIACPAPRCRRRFAPGWPPEEPGVLWLSSCPHCGAQLGLCGSCRRWHPLEKIGWLPGEAMFICERCADALAPELPGWDQLELPLSP